MLKKFTFSGFKSFFEQSELDMYACKGRNIHDNNLLKSSIIFGPNNVGKSNFIRAIAIMREIYALGKVTDHKIYDIKNFSLNDDENISFEITILDQDDEYIYGFEFADNHSVDEYLYKNDDCIFARYNTKQSTDKKVKPNNSVLKDAIYSVLFESMHPSSLYLSQMINIKLGEVAEEFKAIKRFFDRLVFFDATVDGENIDLYNNIIKDEKAMMLYSNFMKYADTGIDGIEYIDDIFERQDSETEDLIQNLLNDVKKRNLPKPIFDAFIKKMSIYAKFKVKGDKTVSKSSIFYNSVGTNKFSQLILVFLDVVKNNKIVFIDEIDNSLHYKLALEIVKLMNSDHNKKSQFIMTAHNTKLLNPKLFRKEQINFIDRDGYSNDMYSLADYKSNSKTDVRPTSSFENVYLSDKVGANPSPDLLEVLRLYGEKTE